MTLALVRDWIDPGDVRLNKVPRWIRPTIAEGYWHIPRSAKNRQGLVVIHTWCSQLRYVMPAYLTDGEPEERRCGTCEGRAMGFERRDGLIFTPRSPFDRPRLCPMYVGDAQRCPLCGGKPAYLRRYAGPGERLHRPGHLIDHAQPCPYHGWKNIRHGHDGVVRCREWVGNGQGECHYPLDISKSAALKAVGVEVET